MSRLSDREIQEIVRSRQVARDEAADSQSIILEARRLRAAVLARLTGRALRPVATLVGPAVRALRDAWRQQSAAAQLRRLDDRMLADIGLDRGMIEGFVRRLDRVGHQPQPSPWARLQRWLETQAAIRKLEALDDRLLRDIGITRGEIRSVVRRSLEAESRGIPVSELIREAEQSHVSSADRALGRQAARRISALGAVPLAAAGYVKDPAAGHGQAAA